MFTHRMKESLGLAEKRTSNDEVRDLSKKLDTMSEHLKLMMKGIQKTTASLREMAEAGVEIGSQLTDFSVLFAEDVERTLLSGNLSRTAEFERMMEDTRVQLATSVDAVVVGGLKAILEGEIKECRTQKAAYESARVDLSNAQTKHATAVKGKQQPKIDAAQADLDAMRKKFDACEKDTLVRLRDGCTVIEYKMLDVLVLYVETQKIFYNRGFQMLNASMVDIAEYRRHADDSRRKLSARPQNPKRVTVRMSIAPKPSRKRFFGASLAELEADGRCIDGVPIFLLGVVVYIEHWGLEEEGLFRVAGPVTITEQIRSQVEANGGDFDWGITGERLLTATDLMKQFLRELPSPLLPEEFTRAAFSIKPSPDPSPNIAFLIGLIHKLPIGTQRILKLLFMLLNRVSKVKVNRMSPVAIATCMGPNLCNMNFGTDLDQYETIAQTNGLVAFMVQHTELLFESVTSGPPSTPASPRAGPASPRAAPSNSGEALANVVASSPPAQSSPLTNPAVAAPSNSPN